MEIYNIKITRVTNPGGSNMFSGTIVIEENKIKGLCTELNNDSLCVIRGSIENDIDEKIYLSIKLESGYEYNFSIKETDHYPKKQIAKSKNFFGNVIDDLGIAKDNMYVSLTNIENIKEEIQNKVLDKKLEAK